MSRPTRLHADDLDPPDWWACEEPERPTDMHVVYEECCPACQIKAAVELATSGDRLMFEPFGREPRPLSDLAAGALCQDREGDQ